MTGEHGESGRVLAMRYGNSRVGGRGNGRRNTRYDFELDAGFVKRFGLFTAATKDERIAAFEAHDATALPRPRQHQRVNFALRHCVIAAAFADEDAFASGRRERDDRIGGERVVE